MENKKKSFFGTVRTVASNTIGGVTSVLRDSFKLAPDAARDLWRATKSDFILVKESVGKNIAPTQQTQRGGKNKKRKTNKN